ncbi:hypothetical protein [Hymenobacter metallicola]|uniref:Uncharacterized protein n=1 Tax=Hymenobacter metallicola TaxID=2563114 RepID=A0A4Z0QFV3_9BACT|nr:hypothetical protein [Hymenobacter metallicola]TGE28209.1 hypothetical protein E5K02_01730 [Hymenobacter metallicola]
MLRTPFMFSLLFSCPSGLPSTSRPLFVPAPPEQDESCPRGVAEPVVRKKVFPKTSFRRLPDKRTGLETVALPLGDRLTIHHEGCEYYVLRFHFETARFRQSPTALDAWFRNAAQLLTETAPGLDSPVDIAGGLRALRTYLDRHKGNKAQALVLGQEIAYGSETLPSFVSVDRIARLAGNTVAVELSLAIGPL